MIFNLETLEISFEKKNWDKAWDTLSSFLKNADRTELALNGKIFSEEQSEIMDMLKRTSVHILNLFLNPDAILSQDHFLDLIVSYTALHHLLSISALSVTDPLLKKINASHPNKTIRESNIRKILCLASMEGSINMGELVRQVPINMAVPAMIGYLSSGESVTKKQYQNTISLYEQIDLFDQWEPTNNILECLCRPYFISSYLDYDQKTNIRKKVATCYNQFIKRHNLHQIKPISKTNSKNKSKKPALLVILEKMRKNDDVYRTWFRRIHALQKKFHVIIVTDKHRYNLKTSELGNETFFFDYTRLDFSIKRIKNLAKKHDIKIAYCPALGMAPWTMLLASMRIVPIQISGLGVMGPPKLKGIDFVLANERFYSSDIFEDQKFISTTLQTPFTKHDALDKFVKKYKPSNQNSKDKIIVGIVGGIPKAGYTFIKFIDEICQAANFPIEIKMFSHAKGIGRLHLKKQYETAFKTPTTFFGFLDYTDYLEEMMSCDVFLNPFPFGHANVLSDLLMLGKPFIALKGQHPASRVDAVYMESLGMTDLFIADNKNAYKEKFMEYCRKIQSGQPEFYDREDIYNKLYKQETETCFADTMMWIYKNRKKLKSTSSKLIVPKIND